MSKWLAGVNIVAVALALGVTWTFYYYTGWQWLWETLPQMPKFFGLGLLNIEFWIRILAVLLLILAPVILAFTTVFAFATTASELHAVRKWHRYAKSQEGKADRWVKWYTPSQRLQHFGVKITLLLCAVTGFGMYFANNPYWKLVLNLDRDLMVTLHIFSGIAMGIVALGHFFHYLTVFLGTASRRGFREAFKSFPLSQVLLLPTYLKTVKELVAWVVRGGAKPKYHKYHFEHHLEYWGEMWGIAVIGITGVLMVLYGPAILNGALWLLHVVEAVLAVTISFALYLAIEHFRPYVFPVDNVYISGKMPLKRVMEEHPLFYREIKEVGRL
ncbi:MAG: hypothetical protein ACK4SY_10220 [Pyrobaculum sp.]